MKTSFCRRRHTSLCGAAAADRTRPQDVLGTERQDGPSDVFWTQNGALPEPVLELTFVFEVLQDGDDGFQWDTVGQEQLPGAVLLKGLPVQRLNCGHSKNTT